MFANISRWAVRLVITLSLTVTAVIIAVGVILSLPDWRLREHVSALISRAVGVQKQPETAADSQWDTPAGRELVAANSQHFYIMLPVAKCFPDVDLLARPVPTAIASRFLFGLQPDGSHSWDTAPMPDPAVKFDLNNFQNYVLYLSDNVSWAQVQAAARLAQSRSRRNLAEWAIVIIGALTTIFISVKAMANERTPAYEVIGVCAIIFSALGTAVASLNAFYSPSDAYVRNTTSLAQLHQLHVDLGHYVVSLGPEVCNPMDAANAQDAKTKATKEFVTRFTGIVGPSGNSAAQPGGGVATTSDGNVSTSKSAK